MSEAMELLRAGADAFQRGRFAEAERHIVAALAAARRTLPPNPHVVCIALANLARLRLATGDLRGAESALVEGMDEVGRHRLTGGQAHVMLLQETAALRGAQGNGAAAEEMLQHARQLLSPDPKNAPILAIVLARLAELRLRDARFADAESN